MSSHDCLPCSFPRSCAFLCRRVVVVRYNGATRRLDLDERGRLSYKHLARLFRLPAPGSLAECDEWTLDGCSLRLQACEGDLLTCSAVREVFPAGAGTAAQPLKLCIRFAEGDEQDGATPDPSERLAPARTRRTPTTGARGAEPSPSAPRRSATPEAAAAQEVQGGRSQNGTPARYPLRRRSAAANQLAGSRPAAPSPAAAVRSPAVVRGAALPHSGSSNPANAGKADQPAGPAAQLAAPASARSSGDLLRHPRVPGASR
jgi:hypothetical protein